MFGAVISIDFRHLMRQLLTLTLGGFIRGCWGIFSEREPEFTFAICYRPSVCRLSVYLSSVTLVRPSQAVQIFGNISTALGTLVIHWHSLKISRTSSQGNPSAGGIKHKRGSQV